MGERNLVLFVIAACALSAVHAMLKPDDMGRKKYDHAVHRLTMEKWRGRPIPGSADFLLEAMGTRSSSASAGRSSGLSEPWRQPSRAQPARLRETAEIASEVPG